MERLTLQLRDHAQLSSSVGIIASLFLPRRQNNIEETVSQASLLPLSQSLSIDH